MFPRSRWVLLRQSNVVLEETLLVSVQSLLDAGLNNDVRRWRKKQGGGTITLNNGSQIIFMAESFDQDKDLNRFKGLEVNGFGIDEINEIEEVTLDKCIERAGSWQHSPGCPRKIFSTCNPTHNWVKTRVYDKFIKGELPTGWAYVPAKITDNPHLDKAYVEGLKDLPIFQYQCFVEGDWDAMPRTGGEFYKLFNHETAVRPLRYDPKKALHLAWDFNVNPYMTCCIWQIDIKWAKRGGEYVKITDAYQIGEICLKSPRNTTKAVCYEFKRLYPGHASGVYIYGDPSGDKEDTRSEKGHNDYTIIRQELSVYKPSIKVQKVAPSVVMRGNFINTVFYAGYNGLNFYLNNEDSSGAMKCTNSINDYLYLKEDSDGTKKKEKVRDPITQVTYEKYGHTSDANDYFICTAFAEQYVEYQRGGMAFPVSLGRNVTRHGY